MSKSTTARDSKTISWGLGTCFAIWAVILAMPCFTTPGFHAWQTATLSVWFVIMHFTGIDLPLAPIIIGLPVVFIVVTSLLLTWLTARLIIRERRA